MAQLTPEERDCFAAVQPFGFILFQRNCQSPEQVKRLTTELRTCIGRTDAPILIDQEGGRVARLKPPHWPKLPPMRNIGALYEQDAAAGLEAATLHSRITATMLAELGITGNCAPVLDLYIEGAAAAIGDRAISADPEIVTKIGRTYLDTHLAHGVVPVIKHFPGHGRVKVDPHFELPVVETALNILQQQDFGPFKALADAPVGMNCHVLFQALDQSQPVSMSAAVHQKIIRSELGFRGLLLSDDLAMEALQGDIASRAQRAMAAGADIALSCAGKSPELQALAAALPPAAPQLMVKWQAALASLGKSQAVDSAKDHARLLELLGKVLPAG
ncbi:MAG: beta-N-acetylhexosaminidase [Alphaproteobacteria bacterium]|nr:beta-N-acetylhexosaminidase [Alphaproteobacteria bacterium]